MTIGGKGITRKNFYACLTLAISSWLGEGSGRFQGYWRFRRRSFGSCKVWAGSWGVPEVLEGSRGIWKVWVKVVGLVSEGFCDVCKGSAGFRTVPGIFVRKKFRRFARVLGFWEFAKVPFWFREGLKRFWRIHNNNTGNIKILRIKQCKFMIRFRFWRIFPPFWCIVWVGFISWHPLTNGALTYWGQYLQSLTHWKPWTSCCKVKADKLNKWKGVEGW